MDEGEWKEIAKDQILAGMKSSDVIEKHAVTSSKRDRAIREAVLRIAEWYDIVAKWKAKSVNDSGLKPQK